MRKVTLGKTGITVNKNGFGALPIQRVSESFAVELLRKAYKNGVDFYDTARFYTDSEKKLGLAFEGMRDKIYIATKTMAQDVKHFWEDLEQSLENLKTDYVDILLLHRPDALMEPEEVAEAFEILEKSGKVKAFGVSNHNPMQIELLNQYCGGKICIDQIQFSAAHCPTIDAGLNVNIHNDAGCDRDGGIIEYARLKKMTLQAWSPFQYGMFEGIFIGNEKFPELNKVLNL